MTKNHKNSQEHHTTHSAHTESLPNAMNEIITWKK